MSGFLGVENLWRGFFRRGLVSRVREVVLYRCGEELGLSAAEIARHVRVAISSVVRAMARERGTSSWIARS